VKYVLMLASDVAYKEDLDDAIRAGCAGWTEDLAERGKLVNATGLRPPSDATTVRVRGEDVLLTDGPFAETKDQIGGLTIIECADLDEALEHAARHPWARVGQVEVRPVWEP
jgi:hypothetical protein